jgi:hypothetical protein
VRASIEQVVLGKALACTCSATSIVCLFVILGFLTQNSRAVFKFSYILFCSALFETRGQAKQQAAFTAGRPPGTQQRQLAKQATQARHIVCCKALQHCHCHWQRRFTGVAAVLASSCLWNLPTCARARAVHRRHVASSDVCGAAGEAPDVAFVAETPWVAAT